MPRHSEHFKTMAVARLLAPECCPVSQLAAELNVSPATLEKWRAEALNHPPARSWSAAARLDAVIATAALDEEAKNAWCRQQGIFPADLELWKHHATQALAAPSEARATPKATRQDKQRIKELERQLHRKDKALAETAALLVLSKKLEAVFQDAEDA